MSLHPNECALSPAGRITLGKWRKIASASVTLIGNGLENSCKSINANLQMSKREKRKIPFFGKRFFEFGGIFSDVLVRPFRRGTNIPAIAKRFPSWRVVVIEVCLITTAASEVRAQQDEVLDCPVRNGPITRLASDVRSSVDDVVEWDIEKLVGCVKPGDTLVLDGMYRIEGSKFQLPDDFTLTATNGGGFEVVDAATNRDPLLYLGNRTIIDNVTVKVSGVPDTGYSGASAKRGVDYADKVVFASYGKHDVTITSSAFEGDVTMFFDFRGGNRLTIEDSRFDGAMYQMRLLGDINDVRVEGSVFRDAIGDGIKTERFDGQGVDGMVVLDSAFVGNNRDGIDTAGGLQNALISRTVFRDNGVSGIDIKAMIERPDDLSTGQLNTNIRIENSEFIDSRNAIVVTMLDRAGLLTKANADTYMPHDIRVVDTIFEKTAHHNEEMRAFLVKDGYNITWTDIRMLGSIDDEVRIMNAEAPQGWSAHNVKGTNVSYGPARGKTSEQGRAIICKSNESRRIAYNSIADKKRHYTSEFFFYRPNHRLELHYRNRSSDAKARNNYLLSFR